MALHKRHVSLPFRLPTPGLVAQWGQPLQFFGEVLDDEYLLFKRSYETFLTFVRLCPTLCGYKLNIDHSPGAAGGGNRPNWERKATLSHSTQISAIRPSSIRKMLKNLLATDLPVAGNSPMGPVSVPA